MRIIERIAKKYFTEEEFIKLSNQKLMNFGFSKANSIVGVCLCRDEISQTIIGHIKNYWGEPFNFASLGGMYTAGKLGLKAFISHSPQEDGMERFIFYALSHIGIDDSGNIGICSRKGIQKSTACGALVAFLKELSEETVKIRFDEDEIEESFLKRRILREMKFGQIVDLLGLTEIVSKVLHDDLESTINKVVDQRKAVYAIFTGIQIHAPESNFIAPKESYVVANGKKTKIVI